MRLSPFDNRVVDIKFFDSRGLDIDKTAERKIESTFFREDYRRVYLDEIGLISDAGTAPTATPPPFSRRCGPRRSARSRAISIW